MFGETEILSNQKRLSTSRCMSLRAQIYLVTRQNFVNNLYYQQENVKLLKEHARAKAEWKNQRVKEEVHKRHPVYKQRYQQNYVTTYQLTPQSLEF